MKAKTWLATLLLMIGSVTVLAEEEGGLSVALVIEQLGKFHLQVLHFPIVFAALLPLLIFITRFEFGTMWKKTIPYFIHGASITVIAVVTFGLLWSVSKSPIGGALYWHRFLGITAAILMILQSVYVIVTKPDFEDKVPNALLVLSSVILAVVGITAHMGGESVYGPFFILFE